MTIEVLFGDMLEILPTLEENSFDSVVTDPPYHLTSIVKHFSKGEPEHTKTYKDMEERSTPIARLARGFMGKAWDGGDIAFQVNTWEQILRVLKPGGHMLCFGGTRTFHRMACAIEDAGFDIRDTLMYLYGVGFPKSHDISKAIDKRLGASREILGEIPAFGIGGKGCLNGHSPNATYKIDNGAVSNEAKQWNGWGTSLKPAYESITLARKPLKEKTVADQVLSTGTGAINIDACRVDASDALEGRSRHGGGIPGNATSYELPDSKSSMPAGRWPANICHDDSDEVIESLRIYSKDAERFFYSAKANAKDRNGSKHPTIKPVSLLQWLCRLVTPVGGKVLDPFAGSGTTGVACKAEGFNCTMIEKEEEYVYDIYKRFEENNLNCT